MRNEYSALVVMALKRTNVDVPFSAVGIASTFTYFWQESLETWIWKNLTAFRVLLLVAFLQNGRRIYLRLFIVSTLDPL